MEDITEIRWHGRGGQGAVTAAKFVAEIALAENNYFQAFPEYGPERMGAPIQAFTRMSQRPIDLRCGVENPDIVVVLDPTLLASVDVTQGLQNDGLLIVNTPQTPAEVKKTLRLEGKEIKVYTVDATKISLETLGRAIPNTPMIGALTKVTSYFSLDKVLKVLEKSFGKKFTAEVIEKNKEAIKRAYDEVRST
jgi:pyruvate ferredoxin oxidoreductase gamma subunit